MEAICKLGTALVSYLLVVAGSIFLILNLSPLIAEQVGMLAEPYLDNGPPKLSLIQQRRIDTVLALPPLPDQGRVAITPKQAPPVSPAVLAAQLDFAEKGDFEATYRIASYRVAAFTPDSQPSSIASGVVKGHIARRKYADVTARDIFNRNFGVITVSASE